MSKPRKVYSVYVRPFGTHGTNAWKFYRWFATKRAALEEKQRRAFDFTETKIIPEFDYEAKANEERHRL